MANKRVGLVILVITLVLGMTVAGCGNGSTNRSNADSVRRLTINNLPSGSFLVNVYSIDTIPDTSGDFSSVREKQIAIEEEQLAGQFRLCPTFNGFPNYSEIFSDTGEFLLVASKIRYATDDPLGTFEKYLVIAHFSDGYATIDFNTMTKRDVSYDWRDL